MCAGGDSVLGVVHFGGQSMEGLFVWLESSHSWALQCSWPPHRATVSDERAFSGIMIILLSPSSSKICYRERDYV